MIALRLGNPRLSKLFDRCPRVDLNAAGVKGITSQSGGLKYKQFEYRKLGFWLVGDFVEMVNMGSLKVPGEAEKKPVQILHAHTKFPPEGPCLLCGR